MATGQVELPEGFVLDEPAQDSLPEGFVLDEPPGAPSVPTMATAPLATIGNSAMQYAGDMFDLVAHPIQTARAIGSLGRGVVEKFTPGVQPSEANVDAVGEFYKSRYGSPEAIKHTLNTDPVGSLADVAMLLSGGGAALSQAGKAGKLASLAQVGTRMARAGEAVDPLMAVARSTGDLVRAGTKGRSIRAPFAGKVDMDVLKAEQELSKALTPSGKTVPGAELNLPASSKVSGRLVPNIEAFVIKGPFGAKLTQKLEKARESLNTIADSVVKKAGKSADLSAAGNEIVRGADKFRDEFIKTKNTLYNQAGITKKGQEIVFRPKRSLDFVQTILDEKRRAAKVIGSAPDMKFYEHLADKLSKGHGISAADMRSTILELNEKVKNFNDPFVTGNRGKLNKLIAFFSEELDEAIMAQRPDLAADLAAANKFYSEGVQMLNSSYGETIFALKDQPDKIIPALFNKGTSIEDIPRIYKLVGEPAVPAIQSAFLEEFFKGAKNASGDFSPEGIARQVKRYGEDKLQAVLSPEQFTAVKNLQTATKSLAGVERVAGGSQTAFMGRVAAELGPLFINPWISLKAILGDAAFSSFVASDFGQKFLSTGADLTRVGQKARRGLVNVGKAGRALRAGTVIRQSNGYE